MLKDKKYVSQRKGNAERAERLIVAVMTTIPDRKPGAHDAGLTAGVALNFINALNPKEFLMKKEYELAKKRMKKPKTRIKTLEDVLRRYTAKFEDSMDESEWHLWAAALNNLMWKDENVMALAALYFTSNGSLDDDVSPDDKLGSIAYYRLMPVIRLWMRWLTLVSKDATRIHCILSVMLPSVMVWDLVSDEEEEAMRKTGFMTGERQGYFTEKWDKLAAESGKEVDDTGVFRMLMTYHRVLGAGVVQGQSREQIDFASGLYVMWQNDHALVNGKRITDESYQRLKVGGGDIDDWDIILRPLKNED